MIDDVVEVCGIKRSTVGNISVRLGGKTHSLNVPMHWRKKARIVKALRSNAAAILFFASKYPPMLPCIIYLTRIAPSNGLDGDNLQGALKPVRDGVADYLQVDDGSPLVTWEYAQERGPKGEYAVRIEIMRQPAQITIVGVCHDSGVLTCEKKGDW